MYRTIFNIKYSYLHYTIYIIYYYINNKFKIGLRERTDLTKSDTNIFSHCIFKNDKLEELLISS